MVHVHMCVCVLNLRAGPRDKKKEVIKSNTRIQVKLQYLTAYV